MESLGDLTKGRPFRFTTQRMRPGKMQNELG